jgi:hypothetical protein
MNDASLTYSDLFAVLAGLGFRENPSGETPAGPRVFFHEQTDAILAFCRKPHEAVTPADILSTEVHLQSRKIVDESLETLLRTMPVAK